MSRSMTRTRLLLLAGLCLTALATAPAAAQEATRGMTQGVASAAPETGSDFPSAARPPVALPFGLPFARDGARDPQARETNRVAVHTAGLTPIFVPQVGFAPRDARPVDARRGFTEPFFSPTPLVRQPLLAEEAAPEEFDPRFRPLDFGDEALTLSGEIDSHETAVFVMPWQVTRDAVIELDAVSAVSADPSVSAIEVSVNDRFIARVAINERGARDVIRIPLPVGALASGFNSVRLTARHSHRVDCSREATFELWTRFAAGGTGLRFSGGDGVVDSHLLLAAARQAADGTTRIRLVSPEGFDAQEMAAGSRLVQAVARLGRFASPAVQIASRPSNEPGIDVFMRVSETGLGGVSVSHANGRVSIDVDARSVEQRDRLIDALSAAAGNVVGTQAGLRAAAMGGVPVSGGERLDLVALGGESQVFGGRHYAQDIRVRMPADFQPGDYGRVELRLNAAHAPGLDRNSALFVEVNGTVVARVWLGNPAGDTIRQRFVPLPLRHFRPGTNTLTLRAETRTASDAACGIGAPAATSERLLVLGTSTLRFPQLARVAQVPNLSGFSAGSLPLIADGVLPVYLPGASREAAEAALTIVTRQARLADTSLPVRFAFRVPGLEARHALVVAPLEDLDDTTLRQSGLEANGLRAAWSAAPEQGSDRMRGRDGLQAPDQSPPRATDMPMARSPLSLVDPLDLTLPGGRPAAETGTRLIDGWQANDPWTTRTLNGIGDGLGQVVSLLALDRAVEFVRRPFSSTIETNPFATNTDFRPHPNARLVVAQDARETAGSDGLGSLFASDVATTTVVTAPSAAELRAAAHSAAMTTMLVEMSGSHATLDPASGRVTTESRGRGHGLVVTDTGSFGAMRFFVASWLSENMSAYLLMLVLAIAVFAGASRAYLTRHDKKG